MLEFDDDEGIDLTPLIDVVFMLLVFFIMTTTFSRPVLDILLPSADSAKQNDKRNEQIIAIKADGSMYYEGREIQKEELCAIMDSVPEARLNLHVDRQAPFEAFVGVIDIAKEKKEGSFVISTQPAPVR